VASLMRFTLCEEAPARQVRAGITTCMLS
jgi:hypothetical protein